MSQLKVNVITNLSGGTPDIPGLDGGGSGGSGSGADAWGYVGANGATAGIMNATVTKTGLGSYTVTFITPMPSGDYSITLGSGQQNVDSISTGNKTANGFSVTVFANVANATLLDGNFNFAVFATNALPPKGGTGTDAWASVQLDGTVGASFNGTVVRTAVGLYEATFITPMPTSNYSVVGSSNGNNGLVLYISSKTASGFTYGMSTGAANLDSDHSWTVNATNATLPDSFSEEQIQSVVDLAQSGVTNPGASAWGDIASGGAINASLNIANVTATGSGYSVTFTTPMPSANYAISSTPKQGPNSSFNYAVEVVSQTETGFEVFLRRSDGAAGPNPGFSFSVFATNALPPKGGTGADAWGNIASDATIQSSFNIDNVVRSEQGRYLVTFTNPMPDTNYLAEVNVQAAANGFSYPANKTVNGFLAVINGTGGGAADLDFGIIVHATNATLPDSFTEAEIQSVVDLAQSGVTNPGASAWGDVAADGTLQGGLNCTTSLSGNLVTVTFITPMPDANYAIAFGGPLYPYVQSGTKTANGFTYGQTDGATSGLTGPAYFTVHATNALPPTGGTGADAWGSWSTDTGDIRASFNIASITPTATGQYDVLFNTPMPVGRYSVTTGSQDRSVLVSLTDKSSTGFKINTTQIASTTRVDASFDFQVNATNAVLPNSFTEAEIQSVVDLAQSGATTRMPGEVTMWSGSSVPSGWLECNGQSTSGFADLAAIVGSNVPDLRGEFVRGWDNGRGVDSGRALGSTQEDMLGNHGHQIWVSGGSSGGAGALNHGGTVQKANYVNTIINSSSLVGTETRPRNVALMYIIKT